MSKSVPLFELNFGIFCSFSIGGPESLVVHVAIHVSDLFSDWVDSVSQSSSSFMYPGPSLAEE